MFWHVRACACARVRSGNRLITSTPMANAISSMVLSSARARVLPTENVAAGSRRDEPIVRAVNAEVIALVTSDDGATHAIMLDYRDYRWCVVSECPRLLRRRGKEGGVVVDSQTDIVALMMTIMTMMITTTGSTRTSTRRHRGRRARRRSRRGGRNACGPSRGRRTVRSMRGTSCACRCRERGPRADSRTTFLSTVRRMTIHMTHLVVVAVSYSHRELTSSLSDIACARASICGCVILFDSSPGHHSEEAGGDIERRRPETSR